MRTPAITAPASVPSGLRLVIASSSDANVVTCWEADLAMSPVAAVAWLTAAWPRSTASPTVFFTDSTAPRAVSAIVSLGGDGLYAGDPGVCGLEEVFIE